MARVLRKLIWFGFDWLIWFGYGVPTCVDLLLGHSWLHLGANVFQHMTRFLVDLVHLLPIRLAVRCEFFHMLPVRLTAHCKFVPLLPVPLLPTLVS